MENEVLNQEPQEEENLFADFEEDTPVESEPAETEPEKTEEEPFLKIQYDKQEYGLSKDEARELAQKGKNYDRMQEKYNTLHDRLERLASLNDMNVDDFLGRLDNTQFDYMVNNEFASLREQYPNDSDEVLREIAESRVNESLNRREHEAQQVQDEQSQRVSRDVEMFLNEYPEFRNQSPDSLDQGVYDLVKKGYTLLEAYNKWSKETPQAKATQKNEENKKRSLGDTTNAGKVEADDFLSGFLNG